MRYRDFLSGFKCSELSLGTLGLSGGYSVIDTQESIRTIQCAVAHGINLVDTADIYGFGLAEELISKALGNCQDTWVVTKVGRDWYKGNNRKNWDSGYLTFAVQNSLMRLRKDTIDVCLLHNPDLDTIEIGEVFHLMEELKRKGDLRHWGVSITTLVEGLAVIQRAQPEVIQFNANIAEPDLLLEFLPLLDPSKVGVMARSPLGCGLLTGKYPLGSDFPLGDYRNSKDPAWQIKLTSFCNSSFRNLELSGKIKTAFEFVLSHANVSTVVCGMNNTEQVKMNIGTLL